MACRAYLNTRSLQRTLIVVTIICAYFLTAKYNKLLSKTGKVVYYYYYDSVYADTGHKLSNKPSNLNLENVANDIDKNVGVRENYFHDEILNYPDDNSLNKPIKKVTRAPKRQPSFPKDYEVVQQKPDEYDEAEEAEMVAKSKYDKSSKEEQNAVKEEEEIVREEQNDVKEQRHVKEEQDDVKEESVIVKEEPAIAKEEKSTNQDILKSEQSIPIKAPQVESKPINYVVPNYAHFIWYTVKPKELKFHQLLSMLSAQRIMKADRIYWHHNMEPIGPYWKEAKAKMPNLILQHREPPKEMFGVTLKEPAFETSHSNADRIKIVQEYGGLYFDLDVIITNPVDPLRVYPATVGLELPEWVCGGFIMSKANSTFLYLWLDTMLNDYQVDKWAYISGNIPSVLVKRFNNTGMVHTEPTKIHRPNHAETMYLIGPESYDWSKNYAIHIWHRLWVQSKYYKHVKVNDAESIKTMKNTYGQVARMVYYGSTEMILD